MKWTKSARIAMERLAPVLGYEVASTGGSWRITNLPAAEGLTFTAVALLCMMTRVATAPKKWDGLALTPKEVREKIRFRPKHIEDPKAWKWYLDLPANIRAMDEDTMYRVYFNPEEDAS